MRTDLMLIAAAEPRLENVWEPSAWRNARFADAAERAGFQARMLRGHPMATDDGVQLNFANMALRFHDGQLGGPPPAGGSFPDSRPPLDARSPVPLTIRHLNGIYLADYLDRHDLKVDVINHLEEDLDLAEAAIFREPVAIGISSTFLPYRQSVERLASQAKILRPDIPVIVGGAMASMSARLVERAARYGAHRDVLRRGFFFLDDDPAPELSPVDYFVVDSRGEDTLVRLLRALRRGDDVRAIPNLAVRNERGGYDFTHRVPERYDPAVHKVRWSRVPDQHLGRVISMENSSGCPFECTFCNFDAYRSGAGVRSPDEVFADMRIVEQRGYVHTVYFSDDILFGSRRAMLDFCEKIKKHRIGLRWGGFARIDFIKEGDAEVLRDAGCTFLNFGVETGSRELQHVMDKHLNPARIPETLAALNRCWISTNTALIVGHPGETAETIDDTIGLLNSYPTNEAGLNYYAAYLLSILPLSPLAEDSDRFGLVGSLYDWVHGTMDIVEAARQHRRLNFEVYGALRVYPGDIAGIERFVGSDPGCIRRVNEIVRCRKEVERAQDAGDLAAADRHLAALRVKVREAVASRDGATIVN